MLDMTYRRAGQVALVALVTMCLPLVAHGGTINIILANMDVSYLGSISSPGGPGAFFDAMGGYSGGSLNPATADHITSAVFEFDNAVLGSITTGGGTNIYGDLKIDGVGASIPKGVFLPAAGNNGGGFGFDFFTNTGYKLRLGINQISLFLNDGIFLFFGQGTLNLADQALPFNLQFTNPNVRFSFTATSVSVPNSTNATIAMGSGAFTITGEGIIPEPATFGLLCLGTLVVTNYLRVGRRRRC